jgi:hypothetical protein
VLSDPSLAQYRCKFPKPKQTITREYNCQDVYYSNKNDSSNVALDDSTVFTPGSNDADEIDLEDNSGTEQPKTEGTKEKKKEKEKEKNNEVVI